jgi:hypothetical protein
MAMPAEGFRALRDYGVSEEPKRSRLAILIQLLKGLVEILDQRFMDF